MPTSPGTTGLVSWWSLNESSGNRNDSHGTNHLSPVAAPSSGAGKVGDGVDLESGSGQYLAIAAASQSGLGSAGSFAFGAWYKMESAPAAFVCSKRDSGAAEFTMTTDGNSPGGLYFYLAPDFNPHVSNAAMPVGSWVFIVVGYNASAGHACVSINGASPVTAARSFGGVASAPFNIGYDQSGGLPKFDGIIDEAFYYTRWPTDDELAWLYNSGSGRAYSELLPPAGLLNVMLQHAAMGYY